MTSAAELAMKAFMRSTEIIDWTHPAVSSKARRLALGTKDVQEIARRCFEWVRDNIQHSSDFKRNPVTCAASEVLSAGTGYCCQEPPSGGIPQGERNSCRILLSTAQR
jgi:transglutaminase-like putative cysteine protease